MKKISKPFTAGIPDISEQDVQDPILHATKVQAYFAKSDKGYRAALYKSIATALYLSQVFLRNKEAYQDLIRKPFWNHRPKSRPKPNPNKSELCRAVTLFVLNGSNEHRANRACKHAKVVRHLWNSKIEPEDVEEQLEQDGGTEKIQRALSKARAEKKESGSGKRAIPSMTQDGDAITAELPEDDAFEGTPRGTNKIKPVSSGGKVKPPKQTDGEPPGEEGEHSVRFFASKKKFEELMALEVGDKVHVSLTRRAYSGAWNVLVANKLKPVE